MTASLEQLAIRAARTQVGVAANDAEDRALLQRLRYVAELVAALPRQAAPALVWREGENIEKIDLIDSVALLVGRSPDCGLTRDDPKLSRRHFQVRAFFIEDLASRNGTRVNGARLTASRALRDGDVIEAGAGVWVFLAGNREGSWQP